MHFSKGVKYVLDNRLCHPLLKSLLPSLKNLIHDNSEKVRIAFLDLLLKVKGMRSIKVLDTCVYNYLGSFRLYRYNTVVKP